MKISLFYKAGMLALSGLTSAASVLAQPAITSQPQSQSIAVGSDATFSVTANTPVPSPTLPLVASGTLQLWLKADAGVITNGANQVSAWQDQSGNGNDATQGNASMQPALVSVGSLGGGPAVQFNGIQDGANGDVLAGSGSVGTPDALTAFTAYSVSSVTNPANMAWFIGAPGPFGGGRGHIFLNGDLDFTTWAYDYTAPYTGPLNTFRICTDRVDTNLTTAEVFDQTPDFSTNFSFSMHGATAPNAGYTVGGLSFVNPDNFAGDIAEIIIYRGYLSDADRLAVTAYLQQKYFKAGLTNDLAYQWMVNNSNIPGATDATLTVTNVQFTNAGTYVVLVSDTNGRTFSSNAVLTVGSSPSIVTQPQSLEVTQGTNASFTVSASGTTPLSYQWYFEGGALDQATNSTLLLSDVQTNNGGYYTVAVSSAFGRTVSSNASLIVDYPPVITTQPETQYVVVGGSATLSVFADGAVSQTSLPQIPSGTLRLWLKADFGVSTDPSNQVSLWEDQSGNTNDASQPDTNKQPLLVHAFGLGGKPTVRFNGIQDGVNGSILTGSEDVATPGAMTAFTVYNPFSVTNPANMAWFIGAPPSFGAGRGHIFLNGDLDFTTWAYDYTAAYTGPTNTYRICTDRLDTNLTTVEIYDETADASTNFAFSLHNVATPAAGYTVGGLNFVNPDNFTGDIAELIVYRGYLSDTDRFAVLNYLEQKYFDAGGASGLTYQWQFDGTNLVGATNSTLTLTNVQMANQGTYAVVVSNVAGVTMSSNTLINVGFAPSITTPPQSFAATLGAAASFTGSAVGSDPLTYQWQSAGTNIAGATSTNYVISVVTFSNLGAYVVVVSNPWAAVTSAPALLALNPQIEVNGNAGTNFAFTNIRSVPIQIASLFSNASIFYTLDGSTPDYNSTAYTAPFGLTQSAVIQAIAYDQNFNSAQSIAVNVTLIISNALTVINPGGGTVALNPPGGLYRNTQTVQVTATPATGWSFLQWTGAVSSANPVINVAMTSPQTLRAVFGTAITVNPATNGGIQLDPPATLAPYGSIVEVVAVPAPGYYFALWGGGTLSGSVNPYALMVTRPNPSVSALFAALAAGHYSLTVIPNGNGGVNINPLSTSYTSNTLVQIRAVPSPSTNRFYYWTGDVTSVLNPLSFHIKTNTTLTANFSGGMYLVEFTTPSVGPTNVQFSLTGAPLQVYDVDVSTNLTNWELFQRVTNATGAIPLSDTTTNSEQKFYRALLH